jgi:hypothetical protein
MILDIQPLYVKGVPNPSVASKGCYTAAGIYVALLGVSVVYWALHEGVGFVRSMTGSRAERNTYGTGAIRSPN